MRPEQLIFIGIDLGTSGVRALAVRGSGEVVASASVPLDPAVLALPEGRHEQPPEAWWSALCQATTKLVADLGTARVQRKQLEAIAVDGTSGTVVAIDADGNPLRPAIMYNDPRAGAEAEELNRLAAAHCEKLGYQFNASFALPKILWLKRHEPEVFGRAHFVHQADYIVGRLRGFWGLSDYSNALKMGYDLIDECWPSWMNQLDEHGVGLVRLTLPHVVQAPGTRTGLLKKAAAAETGLPEGLQVIAGATDGTAAFLASGARQPGDYNTTLGTTLVFKGISTRICRHMQGLIYCHKLPGGLWLPGAASNTGTEWIAQRHPGGYPSHLDAEVSRRLPSEYLAYPLVRRGERFPFLCPSASGFMLPQTEDSIDAHAACLQGVAFVERLSYEVLDQAAGRQTGGQRPAGLGASPLLREETQVGSVYSTGGGSRSDLWMQCRADVTGRVIHRPACPESAFGGAVLAAGGTIYEGIGQAIETMVHHEKTFTPSAERAVAYDRLYGRFCEELTCRGYL